MNKLFLILVGILAFSSVANASPATANGKLLIQNEYDPMGERNWFVTVSGTGDCTSWDRACTLRDVLSKLNDDVSDVIYLGAGEHNTDNGSDATGTTISNDYVKIKGVSGFTHTKLYNGAASADYVLRVTGDNFVIEDITFSNGGQADQEVVYLNLREGPTEINRCIFLQVAGASGTGILLDNSSLSHLIRECRFNGIVSYAIQINGSSGINMERLWICDSGNGINVAGENDSIVTLIDSFIGGNTTGINISGTNVTLTSWKGISFCANTTNVTDNGAYGESHFEEIYATYKRTVIYPENAGTSVSTGDGLWTWTAAPTTLIPVDTVTSPFIITDLNVQSYDVSQTYKIEIFYGEATADISLGIFEFTVGSSIAGARNTINLNFKEGVIPANSIVGAKLKSSTAGVDSIVITLSYKTL